MIKAEPGHSAYYGEVEEEAGKVKAHVKKVVAWADDGHPMVVGYQDHPTARYHKALVRAESLPGYEGIGVDGDPLPFAFIPGNGWMVEREDGSKEPLVAWAVGTYGGGTAGMVVFPMFTEEEKVFGSDRVWTTASLGSDLDPVRVVPEKRSDRG